MYVCMHVCMHVHMLLMHNAHLEICAWLGETNYGGVEFCRCARSAKVFGYDRGPHLSPFCATQSLQHWVFMNNHHLIDHFG